MHSSRTFSIFRQGGFPSRATGCRNAFLLSAPCPISSWMAILRAQVLLTMHSPRCRLDHRRDLPSSLNHSKNYGVLLNTVKYIRNIKQKPLHKAYWESYKKFNCFDLQGDGVPCTAPTGLRLETAIGYFHFPNMREEGIPDLHFSKRSLLHSIVSANCTLADFFFFKRYYNNVIEEKSATGSNFSKYTKKH